MKIILKWADIEYDVLSYDMETTSGGQLANMDTVGMSLTIEAQPKAGAFKKIEEYVIDQEEAAKDSSKGSATLTVFPGDGKGKESIKTIQLSNIIVSNMRQPMADHDDKLYLNLSLTAVNTTVDAAQFSSDELKKSTGIDE